MRRLVILVLLLAPVVVMAQEPRFEIVPTLAYRWGGTIAIEDQAINLRSYDVDMGDAGAFGLIFDLRMTDRMQLELMINRQDTRLEDDQGLFGEEPGWIISPGSSEVLDTDVTYYHVGAIWDLGDGPNRWFIGASGGVTHFDFELPLNDDTRFSASGVAGMKVKLNDRLGLRFGARVYWTDTNQNAARTQFVEHPDCGSSCAYVYRYKDYFFQTELSVGLAISL
jgi:hypothetical protein